MGSAEAPIRSDGGFTVIEVLLACLLITIGLLALAGAIETGFGVVMTAQEDTIARQKAREALESVLTGRNTANISFSQIDNVGTGNGIFLTGFQPLYQPGADGIIGTADDAAEGMETITLPGPDGILGTADDIVQPLENYQRKIEITDLSGTLKQIKVTIQYTTPSNLARSVVMVCYVSPYIN